MTAHRNLLRDELPAVADHVLRMVRSSWGSKVLEVRKNGRVRVWDVHKAGSLDGDAGYVGRYLPTVTRDDIIEDLDFRLRELRSRQEGKT